MTLIVSRTDYEPKTKPNWSLAIAFGCVFAVPSVALFVLALQIRRGHLAAAVAAIVVGVMPASVMLAAFFASKLAGGPAAAFIPFVTAVPSLYLVANCWNAIPGMSSAARQRRVVAYGFLPVMTGQRKDVPAPSRPTVLPPRPTLSGRAEPSRRPPSRF